MGVRIALGFARHEGRGCGCVTRSHVRCVVVWSYIMEDSLTRSSWLIALILALFSAAVVTLDSSSGTDLTPSYISCRLIQSGQVSHLYAHDPTSFNTISDPVWMTIAQTGGVPKSTIVVPFVQTPLWPYLLQPLCGRTNFPNFNLIFRIVLCVCLAALIWITGYFWAPRFFKPLWVLLFVAAWLRADPLRDAVLLTQTHIIFLLLTFMAILWARSGRSVWAGISLTAAAAVKITPGAIILYWLMTKQKKAVLSFIFCSVAILALTVLVVGRTTMTDYIHSMSRVSNILLLSAGNQSLAAWWMGDFYMKKEALSFRTFPLPAALKVSCLGLVVASTIVGGYCDQRLSKLSPGIPPYGAVFALLGATVFTPIAWAHYYIILVVPLILLLDDYLRQRSYAVLLLIGSIFVFANYRLLLRHARYMHLPTPEIVWGQFYAGILAMVAMLLLYWRSLTKLTSANAGGEPRLR